MAASQPSSPTAIKMQCKHYGDGTGFSRDSNPMPFVGMYIALASFLCAAGLVGDLVHSCLKKKLWVPPNLFKVNSATLGILGVAIKISADINGIMSGLLDQLARLTGLVLVCISMTHAAPYLGMKDDSAMFSNLLGFAILLLTLFGNTMIDFTTGAIGAWPLFYFAFTFCMLFNGLLLMPRTSLVQVARKRLEGMYNSTHRKIADEIGPDYFSYIREKIPDDCPAASFAPISTMKLREYIAKYSLMAASTSPQYLLLGPLDAASAFVSAASGVMCLLLASASILAESDRNCYFGSDYQRSTAIVLLFQLIGILAGTVICCLRFALALYQGTGAPYSIRFYIRYLNALIDRPINSNRTYQLPKKSHNRIFETLSKNRFRIVLLLPQVAITFLAIILLCYVVSLPMVAISYICGVCCYKSWGTSPEQFRLVTAELGIRLEEATSYILLVQGQSTQQKQLQRWLTFPIKWIHYGQSRKPDALLSFLQKNSSPLNGFKRLSKILGASSEEFPNPWSLTVVTLAYVVHSISSDSEQLLTMMKAVEEGFRYTALVDKNFPLEASGRMINAAKLVWQNIDPYGKRLDCTRYATPKACFERHINDIMKEAFKIINDHDKAFGGEAIKDLPLKVVAAKSLCNIAPCVGQILNDIADEEHSDTDPEPSNNCDDPSKAYVDTLLEMLQGILSDSLCACLINLPLAIIKNCSTGGFGDKEASVKEAATVSGEVEDIFAWLLADRFPTDCPAKMEYLDSWKMQEG